MKDRLRKVRGDVAVMAKDAAVFHAQAPDVAEKFKGQLSAQLECKELFVFECSPVIGTHTGPGVIGVSFYPEA